MKFYSQAGEDEFMISSYLRDLAEDEKFYIEIGGLDGVTASNTKTLEDELGWTGILVEPHPLSYKKLEVNRPNNFLFNALVSSSKDPLEFRFFENQNMTGVSGVPETHPANIKERFF